MWSYIWQHNESGEDETELGPYREQKHILEIKAGKEYFANSGHVSVLGAESDFPALLSQSFTIMITLMQKVKENLQKQD